MTISTTDSRISYNGNGVTTDFAFPYRFFENADLVVELVDAAGAVTTQVLNTDYTVAGADLDAGGTVTMIVAPASGERLVIRRVVEATQETDYISGDPFPAESHERALDRLTMLVQQNLEVVNRALVIPSSDTTGTNVTLPRAADRADKVLRFDTNGNVQVSAIGSLGGPVSDSSQVEFIPAGTGAVATTVQAKLREFLTFSDFGAVEDGTTDETSKVADAVSAAISASRKLVLSLKNALYFTSLEIPSDLAIGSIQGMAQNRNLIPNGNFHTWQRVEVRLLSPAQFTINPPTFGDPATYEGTGGLPVYGADMWYAKVFGLFGSAVVTRQALSAAEAKITSGTEWKLNWNATSVTAPAAKNIDIASATAATASPVTIETVAPHGLTTGDYIAIRGNVYAGGNGGLQNAAPDNGTYQVTVVDPTTFTIAITPDAGAGAYSALGRITDDPDSTGFAHTYDGVGVGNVTDFTRNWVRSGTASHILQCRIPTVRFTDGTISVRLRVRRNSGTPVIRVRLVYDFGTGGSPTTSTSTVALLAQPSDTDIHDYVACVPLPDLAGTTFGTTGDTGYLAVSLEADPNTFDLDVYSVVVRPGVALLPNDNWSRDEAFMYLRRYYQGVRVGVLQTTAVGSFYGVSHSFNPPMRGTPTVTRVRDVAIANFNTPTVSNNRSREGFTANAQATTAAANQWSTIFECEYNIPT